LLGQWFALVSFKICAGKSNFEGQKLVWDALED